MKKLFLFLLILLPFISYAQIWEGGGSSGSSPIVEGIGFGSGGSGGGDIDWDDFTGDKCTITFQNYEGTYTQPMVVPVGVPSSYVMPDVVEPTKDGYIFGGWSLYDDYPTPVTMPDNFVATTTYYAIFTKTKYTVYYRNTDNSLYTSQIYEYGDAITEPTEPTYDNDYFWDWSNLPDDMPPATFTVNALVFPKTTTAYGLEVDLSAVSSATAYTYLYNAVGMDPIRVSPDGTFNNFNDSATSWKSFIYQYVQPCMLKLDGTVDYYLNPDDQSLKADGVTASDISNASYEGNAMVEFRKLWSNARNIRGTRKYKMIISPSEISNITYAEAFKRDDGTYVDNVYYAMFNASYANRRAKSINVGNTDSGSNQTISNMRDKCQANGNGWDICYEALTQHIYKIAFLVSKSVEPTGALFNKANMCVNYNSEATLNNKQYGVSNGCFYVQGNNSRTGLIKTLWINEFWGNRAMVQMGLCYYNRLVKYKNPPYPAIGSLDGFETIRDYTDDALYNYSGNNLYCTRYRFHNGVAYEGRVATNSNSVSTNVLFVDPCFFYIPASERKAERIMLSSRNFPYRLDASGNDIISMTSHHCGTQTSVPNGRVWGYRLTYIEPPQSSSLLMSPRSLKTLRDSLKNEEKREIVDDYATPTIDIGDER